MGDVPTDSKFIGQRLDDTGLYYYGARYYDVTIGRFISPDTIVPGPANPQAFNRYSYCMNNPLKFIDPTGHLVKFAERKERRVWISWPFTRYREYVYHDLELAWRAFKAVAPDVASLMELSSTEYTIAWAPIGGQGSACTGFGGDQMLWIDKNLQGKSYKEIAYIIAHESVHARQGKISDSIYEEVVAYQYQYMIGIQLGITSTLPTQMMDINLGLTGDALKEELERAKAILEETGNIIYQNIPIGGSEDIFPLDMGGGNFWWGYTPGGSPIICSREAWAYYQWWRATFNL